MAEVNEALVPSPDVHILRVKWLDLANGDTGRAVGFSAWQDRSVQVLGTFGASGSVSIQGSNDGGTTWATLTDPLGNALTFTAAGIKQVVELPYQIRPIVTNGDGTTAIDVWLHARGAGH